MSDLLRSKDAMFTYKLVTPDTMPLLHELILESALEYGSQNEVSSTVEQLTEDAFGNCPAFQALLAWKNDEAVGVALWFTMYSAWKGKKTLYLEDLYVQPLWRKKSVGTNIFLKLEQIALKNNANLAWECSRDRLDLRRFFTNMGAIDRSDKVSFYMDAVEMEQHLSDYQKLKEQ